MKTIEDFIGRLRTELDKIYEKYEGHPLIEDDDILGDIEYLITEYYEDKDDYMPCDMDYEIIDYKDNRNEEDYDFSDDDWDIERLMY